MANLQTLEPDEQLTYFVGDIIRNDAFAETEARSVWIALARSETAAALLPRDLARVLEQCRDMVKQAVLDEPRTTLVTDVLSAAAASHAERSVLAHDQWMHHLPNDQEWHSVRAFTSRKQLKAQRPLDDFIRCRDDLLRAGWQLRSLWLLLPEWLGDADALADIEESRAFWLQVVAGRFDITPDGLTIKPRR